MVSLLSFVFIFPVQTSRVVLGQEMRCKTHPPRPLSRSHRACPRYTWNTSIFLKNTVQTVQRCASARRSSLMPKLARWMPAQLLMPPSRPFALQKTARLGPCALLPLLSGKSDF